jgi:hypothetical protein
MEYISRSDALGRLCLWRDRGAVVGFAVSVVDCLEVFVGVASILEASETSVYLQSESGNRLRFPPGSVTQFAVLEPSEVPEHFSPAALFGVVPETCIIGFFGPDVSCFIFTLSSITIH